MTKTSYKAYLKTANWYRLRARKLHQVGYKCEKCGRVWSLHIHHLTYSRVGKECLKDLQVLCRRCHKLQHPNWK